MHCNAITAAAVLAFTSAAMAMNAEPASTAVAQFVAQPTSATNVMDEAMVTPEEEVADDEEGLDKRWTRGGHGLYSNWQKGLTRGGAKRDVHGDHYRAGSDDDHGRHGGKSGAEGNAMGPGGRHGGVKRGEHAEHEHVAHGWHKGPEHAIGKRKGADHGEHGKYKRDADKPKHGGKEGHHGKHWNETGTEPHTNMHGDTKKFHHHKSKNGIHTGTHTSHSHHSKSMQSTSSTTNSS